MTCNMTSGHGFYNGFTVYEFGFITLNISSLLEQLVHWSQTANQKRNSQSHRNDSWLLRNCWLTLPNWSYLIIDFSPKLFSFTIWICLNIWGAWSHQIQVHSSGRQILCSMFDKLTKCLLSHHIVVIQMSDKPPAGTKSFILNMVPEVCPVPGNFEPHAFSYFKYVCIYIYIHLYIYICLSLFFIRTIYICICLFVV